MTTIHTPERARQLARQFAGAEGCGEGWGGRGEMMVQAATNGATMGERPEALVARPAVLSTPSVGGTAMPAENPSAARPHWPTLHERMAALVANKGAVGKQVRHLLAKGEITGGDLSYLRVGGRALLTLVNEAIAAGGGPRFKMDRSKSTRLGPRRSEQLFRYFKAREVLYWALMRGELAVAVKGAVFTLAGYHCDHLGEIERLRDEVDRLRHEAKKARLLSVEELRARSEPTKGRGLYFLWAGDRLLYIGMSECVSERLGSQSRDKDFDRVTFLPVPEGVDLSALEALYIRALSPSLNQRCANISEERERQVMAGRR